MPTDFTPEEIARDKRTLESMKPEWDKHPGEDGFSSFAFFLLRDRFPLALSEIERLQARVKALEAVAEAAKRAKEDMALILRAGAPPTLRSHIEPMYRRLLAVLQEEGERDA